MRNDRRGAKACSSLDLSLAMVLVFGCVTVGAWVLPSFAEDEKPSKKEARAKEEPAEKEAGKSDDEEKEPKKEDRYLAVVGGDLHTVSGPVLKHATLVAKNGKIVSMGVDVEVPEEAEVLDATGRRVYPGLVAVYSSGVVGSGRSPEDGFNPYSINVVLALANGITTVVTGNNAVKLTYGTLEGHLLKKKLFVDLPARRKPASIRKLRQDLEKVRQYLRDLNDYQIAKASGDTEAKEPDKKWLKGKYLDVLRLVTGEARGKVRASSVSDLRSVLGLVNDYGIDVVIDRATEAWILPAEVGRSGAKLIVSARKDRQPGPDPRLSRLSGWNIESSRILYDHGVPFAIIPNSTGISTLFGMPGRDLLALPMEAAFAVRGGLPEAAALEAITLGAARILGIEAYVGSLEIGKDADFVVTDGDILHYNTWVQVAVVNGRIAYDKQTEPIVRHIRSREPESADDLFQFWPRRATDPTGRRFDLGEDTSRATKNQSDSAGAGH